MAKIFNRSVAIAEGTLKLKYLAGTDSSQAITQNAPAGKIISSTVNLAAKTTEDILVTNRYCRDTSIILATVAGGGAGDVVVCRVTPSNGSFVITTLNADPSNACNAAYIVRYVIVNPANEPGI